MSAEIVWEDPPEIDRRGGRRSPWDERLAPLREHPGKWANLGSWDRSTSSNIVGCQVGSHLPGEFEAVMRHIDKSTFRGTLYVRFVGEAT